MREWLRQRSCAAWKPLPCLHSERKWPRFGLYAVVPLIICYKYLLSVKHGKFVTHEQTYIWGCWQIHMIWMDFRFTRITSLQSERRAHGVTNTDAVIEILSCREAILSGCRFYTRGVEQEKKRTVTFPLYRNRSQPRYSPPSRKWIETKPKTKLTGNRFGKRISVSWKIKYYIR